MDPLSVAASIITLIAAAGSIVQHLEYVKSRMTPYAELLAIMNTVTDLQATLIVVRYEYESLRNSRIPAARLVYQTLPDTIKRLQQCLDQLVDFAHANLVRNGKGLSRLGLSKAKREQLVHIRDDISDAHRNLQLLLHSANLSV
ncbi:hypothetical protein P171DRAFT_522929 [Karstenula rhodostoma CBS 690.94]|uniref:Fungal N-terminal domain-containing protein n=1 Tax=Karstenula rhodostoma CBS 690.94 TaxID=1392251 RepID=A0A9P4PDB6_9PLEO|nr:hypothetical protein P171DRAFT_522929 [Karstenula rhodostoma CBS 690.94]